MKTKKIFMILLSSIVFSSCNTSGNGTNTSNKQTEDSDGQDSTIFESVYVMKISYQDITKQEFDSLEVMSQNEQFIIPENLGQIMRDELVGLLTDNEPPTLMGNNDWYDSKTKSYISFNGYFASHKMYVLHKNPPGEIFTYLINSDRSVYPILYNPTFQENGSLMLCNGTNVIDIYKITNGIPELLVRDITDWMPDEAFWITDNTFIMRKLMPYDNVHVTNRAKLSALEVRYCLATLLPAG